MSGLKIDDYSFSNAVLWGNCKQHYQKAQQSTGKEWLGHTVMSIVEFPPLIGQIVSIAEWALASIANFFTKVAKSKPLVKDDAPSLEEVALKAKIKELKIDATQEAKKWAIKKGIAYEPKMDDYFVSKKKADLLEQGLERLSKIRPPKQIEMSRLDDSSKYLLTENNDPQYFSNAWKNQPLNMTTTSAFFDYAQEKGEYAVDVDFANRDLGGAWEGHGFVQEEIMVFEMPDFAALLSENIGFFTRTQNAGKTGPGILEGSPTPIMLKDLLRVQAVDNHKAYGLKISAISNQELLDSTLPITNPQKVNLLAIAAPKLTSKNAANQYGKRTLKDIFNTLMAGIELAEKEAKVTNKPLLLRSGKLGCGVFNNSPHAVYLMHCLALSQTGIECKLYGYSDSEVKAFEESWKTVSQRMPGKSLVECLDIISEHLTNPASENIITSLFNKVMSKFW